MHAQHTKLAMQRNDWFQMWCERRHGQRLATQGNPTRNPTRPVPNTFLLYAGIGTESKLCWALSQHAAHRRGPMVTTHGNTESLDPTSQEMKTWNRLQTFSTKGCQLPRHLQWRFTAAGRSIKSKENHNGSSRIQRPETSFLIQVLDYLRDSQQCISGNASLSPDVCTSPQMRSEQGQPWKIEASPTPSQC